MLQGIKTEKPAMREVKLTAVYDETGKRKEEMEPVSGYAKVRFGSFVEITYVRA